MEVKISDGGGSGVGGPYNLKKERRATRSPAG